ncbi:hypothetical protein ACC754_40660, partial [Rhizobium johnstonii]
LVNAAYSSENDVLKWPWTPLDAFAFVESLVGRTKNVEQFIVNRFYNVRCEEQHPFVDQQTYLPKADKAVHGDRAGSGR